MSAGASQAAGQVLKQLGPQLKTLASKYGPQLLGLLKKAGPQVTSALKGAGKFAVQNPELTNQLLATSLGALATTGTTGTTGAQGAQISPEMLQSLINIIYGQNRNKKCEDCNTIRQKKQSGQALTEEEKKLEEDACKACLEFCALIDKNPSLQKIPLCDLLKAM